MKMMLIRELSPQTVIVEVKTDTFEGRKMISREDYLAGRITFDDPTLYEAERSGRRSKPTKH